MDPKTKNLKRKETDLYYPNMKKKRVIKKKSGKKVEKQISVEEKSPEKKVVLVVDDHVQTTVSISNFLDENGIRTFQAYNFEDALEINEVRNPSIIVINSFIHGKDAFEIISKIPKKKFIILSPAMGDTTKFSNKKEVIAILEKPISNKDILDKVIESK
jgi:response regulator RpfG family c-di-GMP phosphodiesterase